MKQPALNCLVNVDFKHHSVCMSLTLPVPRMNLGGKLRIKTHVQGISLETTLRSEGPLGNYYTDEVEVPDWMDIRELKDHLLKGKWTLCS